MAAKSGPAGMRWLWPGAVGGVDTSGRTQRMAPCRGPRPGERWRRPSQARLECEETGADGTGVPSYERKKSYRETRIGGLPQADSSQVNDCLSTRFTGLLERSVKHLSTPYESAREDEEPVTVSDEVLRRSVRTNFGTSEFRAEARRMSQEKHIRFPHMVGATAPRRTTRAGSPPQANPALRPATKITGRFKASRELVR